MSDIFGELKELSEKAHKYDNLKGRYEVYGNRLRDALDLIMQGVEGIRATMAEINPVATSVKKRSGRPYVEWLEELYAKMLTGVVVSVDLIAKTYDIDDRVAKYVHQKLKAMPKVLKRRDRKRVLLYIQRDI